MRRPDERDPMTHGLMQTIETPDGAFTIVANAAGAVLGSGWTDDIGRVLARISPVLRPRAVTPAELDAADAVHTFYAGDIAAIDRVEVAQAGTDMQRAGWAALRRIMPGRPLTYTGFAEALGRPRAVRAAASICARNAPALFVPCHRVLRGDGTMGGFAWGVEVKRSLLAREASH